MNVQVYIDGKPYAPLPKQLAFHQCDAKFRFLCGGFGSGKTVVGCIEAIKTALQYPGSRGMVCRLTESELKRTTWATLLAILPPEVIQLHIQGDFYLLLKNGSEIQGMHLQKEQNLRSENLDWVYVDEGSEIKEAVWLQLMGRLRGKTTGGRTPGPLKMWVTSNPEGRNWLYKQFIENPTEYDAYFHAPTSENPHLPQSYVDSLLARYDREWVKKFLEGSWDVFEGQVFPMFERDIHVLEWEPFQIPKEWPRYRAIDHGWTDPAVCLWGSKDLQGNLYCYNLLYRSHQTIEANCKMINEMSEGETYEWTVWDTQINETDPTTGRRLADIYQEHGVYGINANKSWDVGVAKVRELLQVQPERIHPVTKNHGSPKIFILYQLKELIWELQQLHFPPYDPNRRTSIKSIGADHAIDCLRYMVMHDPRAAEVAATSSMYDYMTHIQNKSSREDEHHRVF